MKNGKKDDLKMDKKKIHVPHKKLIKGARIKEIDTGQKKEVTIIDENGVKRIEQQPIMQRVTFDPVYEDALLEKEVFAVKTMAYARPGEFLKTAAGLLVEEMEEEHQFASKEDADNFIESTRKANR